MTDAFNPDVLAREIIVRYRGDGHVRFALPALLCEEAPALAVEAALRAVPGVYRVLLYRRQGKLSVFYDAHACALSDVARGLRGALDGLAGKPEKAGKAAGVMQRLRAANPVAWFKDRAERAKTTVEEWRFKASLLKQVIAYHPQMNSLFSERAILNFLNDLVTFYLIKVHWDMITQKWLRQPIRYRSAWLATFYLVFLLVRGRKQAAKPLPKKA